MCGSFQQSLVGEERVTNPLETLRGRLRYIRSHFPHPPQDLASLCLTLISRVSIFNKSENQKLKSIFNLGFWSISIINWKSNSQYNQFCFLRQIKVLENGLNQGVTYLDWKRSSGWLESWEGLRVISDWRFDNLCGSHLQSQDSEDDFHTGRRNVSH